MVKKGIDLMNLSPHRWLHRVLWRDQDPAMACDACSWKNARIKMCVFCKFRSATMEEFIHERTGARMKGGKG